MYKMYHVPFQFSTRGW
uniref:Uncharacterized protein n=1 Tax=Anguilla anguilla TaxID=7936 RepID=A0A0E9XNB7_ANGAN